MTEYKVDLTDFHFWSEDTFDKVFPVNEVERDQELEYIEAIEKSLSMPTTETNL